MNANKMLSNTRWPTRLYWHSPKFKILVNTLA